MNSPNNLPVAKNTYSFTLRKGVKYFGMIDVEVSQEPDDKLSIYLKTPGSNTFKSVKPENKYYMQGGPLHLSLSKDISRGNLYSNPYMSWHNSINQGKIHANAYSSDNLKEVFLTDSPAYQMSDLGDKTYLLFTSLLPLSTNSYYETFIPREYTGNYIEVSSNPLRMNKSDADGGLIFAIDNEGLLGKSVLVDVILHNQKLSIGFGENDTNPYPNNWKIKFVSHPIKITFANKKLPAVTLMVYQLATEENEPLTTAEPLVLWARSKNAEKDLLFHIIKSD